MYRWWMPLAYTDDAELRSELQDIATSGAGGVEVAPFVVPGAGNQSTAFTAQYGWGTPAWVHKIEVITAEAARLGLTVDQNLGPQYPATVPSLNSFNQPEAEQQLIYGREFNDAGSTRSGALPAPTTAPPTITTKLCGAATSGDDVVKVQKLGGFAAGDTVTIGSGATAENVVVTGLGDRTAACGDLSVSAAQKDHTVDETVVTTARTTRIRTLVAQCAAACSTATTAPISLVPDSVTDVTGQVTGGKLDHAFPAGNGNPWVVIDFKQTASGLIAQSGGYTATHPNYVVDHWNRGGARIQGNFWDENIITDAVQRNLDAIGTGAVFEDSLELGSTQKWTWNLLADFERLRGYDLTPLLPALAGAGLQGSGTPAFELAGLGSRAREDYRQTMSDLYSTRYVATMQRWARSHGLTFRAQPYGTPIDSGAASAALGIPEGESLNFGAGNNGLGGEQNYRVISGGAHLGGRPIVSVECCAAFMGNFRSSLAGPSVPGQYGEGGDGSQVGGKYSQGLLDTIYRSYAGGVNQLVWHGYAYRDAPAGVGISGRDGGTWPGYHPWDIFGALNVNDEFGPRQASWPDYAHVNDALARTQLVLRQGKAAVDLGIYYDQYGLLGNSVGTQGPVQHLLGNNSATSRAGYTYEYVAPTFLTDPDLDVEADGGLFGDRSDQKALVLNNQTTLSVATARRLLELAKNGLRLYVVGEVPSTTPGAEPDRADLPSIIEDLLDQPSVTRVATEDLLPAALDADDIRPAVAPAEPTSALGLVRRRADGVTYDFVHNRSNSTVETEVTLSGSGQPYRLDTWTGSIEPIADYTSSADGISVRLRLAPHDAVIFAVAANDHLPAPAPAVHSVESTGEVRSTSSKGLVLRATADGNYITRLSNGVVRATAITGLAPAQTLATWTLAAQTWTPGANQYTTVKTEQAAFSVQVDGDGRLASWRQVTAPVDLSTSSGVGVYTTEVTLPATWSAADSAYLDLGAVLDSVQVKVNDSLITVNQADRGRIDLGKTLRAGTNTVEVRVATTMFNAVRKTGDTNYQQPAWQNTGLMGPVVLTPYRDAALQVGPDIEQPTALATSTQVTLKPQRVSSSRRAKAVVTVSATAPVAGTVRIVIDGKTYRKAVLTNGQVKVRLPRLRVGVHRIRAVFIGTDTLLGSKSKARRLTVVRWRS